MKPLQLYELAEVSNNSHLTQKVLNSLNEKLDDTDMRNFREWLRLVNQHTSYEVLSKKQYFKP